LDLASQQKKPFDEGHLGIPTLVVFPLAMFGVIMMHLFGYKCSE
jgi:hypothetical protein